MLWLWCASVVLLTVLLLVLGRWVRRRQDEALPHESTLSETEQNQARLGIALSAGNTMTTPH